MELFSLKLTSDWLTKMAFPSLPPVVFSSMTSLQTEEFFELVATAQARRLDDQRALLSSLPKSRTRSLRGSIKQLTLVRRPIPAPAPDPKPAPAPKEDLYNMILTTQVSHCSTPIY